MKTNKLHPVVFIIFCALLMQSCTEQYTTDENDPEIESLAFVVKEDTSAQAAIDMGSVGNNWRKVFKSCMQKKFFKNPVYLGTSNVQGLGALYSKDGLEFLDTVVLSITNSTKSIGTTGSCDALIDINVNVSSLLEAKWTNPAIEAMLSAEFNRAVSTKTIVKKWRIEQLAFSQFMQRLEDSKGDNPDMQHYYEQMNGKFIIREALWAEEFETEITISDSISAALRAALDSGVVSADFGGAKAKIAFSRASDKTIKAVSNKPFVVFGKLEKISKK